jgi:hypothetical protein
MNLYDLMMSLYETITPYIFDILTDVKFLSVTWEIYIMMSILFE